MWGLCCYSHSNMSCSSLSTEEAFSFTCTHAGAGAATLLIVTEFFQPLIFKKCFAVTVATSVLTSFPSSYQDNMTAMAWLVMWDQRCPASTGDAARLGFGFWLCQLYPFHPIKGGRLISVLTVSKSFGRGLKQGTLDFGFQRARSLGLPQTFCPCLSLPPVLFCTLWFSSCPWAAVLQ